MEEMCLPTNRIEGTGVDPHLVYKKKKKKKPKTNERNVTCIKGKFPKHVHSAKKTLQKCLNIT